MHKVHPCTVCAGPGIGWDSCCCVLIFRFYSIIFFSTCSCVDFYCIDWLLGFAAGRSLLIAANMMLVNQSHFVSLFHYLPEPHSFV